MNINECEYNVDSRCRMCNAKYNVDQYDSLDFDKCENVNCDKKQLQLKDKMIYHLANNLRGYMQGVFSNDKIESVEEIIKIYQSMVELENNNED